MATEKRKERVTVVYECEILNLASGEIFGDQQVVSVTADNQSLQEAAERKFFPTANTYRNE